MIDGRYVFPYISARSRQQRERQYGEVSEWLKEHAWKVCIRQRIGGSNPPLTAIFRKELVRKYGLFFHLLHVLWGDENPRPGFDNWRQPVGQTANAESGLPAGRAKRVNPPLTAIFGKRARTKVRAFFSPVAHRRMAALAPYPAYEWRSVGLISEAPSGLSEPGNSRRRT